MAGHVDSIAGGFPTTGSICRVLGKQGAAKPDGAPYSEAYLMGIAGGAAFGYFVFRYGGHDPQVNLLTRNTFNNYAWDAVIDRLRIAQDVVHSTSEEKARKKLTEALDASYVPIAWADVFTLGYEYSEFGEGMWAMQPVVVESYDAGGNTVFFDRSAQPITVDSHIFDTARGRVKKDKYRFVTLESPAVHDQKEIVEAGIRESVALFYDKPPKGSASNFGLKAYDKLITDLRKPDSKTGWGTLLGTGRSLFAGLTSAFKYGLQYWSDQSMSADRNLFARFIEESPLAVDLGETAALFREAGAEWKQLGLAILPDSIPLLAEARALLTERHTTFLDHGAVPRLAEIDQAFGDLRERGDAELGDESQARQLYLEIADQIERIRNIEHRAFTQLKETVF